MQFNSFITAKLVYYLVLSIYVTFSVVLISCTFSAVKHFGPQFLYKRCSRNKVECGPNLRTVVSRLYCQFCPHQSMNDIWMGSAAEAGGHPAVLTRLAHQQKSARLLLGRNSPMLKPKLSQEKKHRLYPAWSSWTHCPAGRGLLSLGTLVWGSGSISSAGLL